ncbi:MAG: putative signaling protein [Proteobacteria bacterium]|nr:MAG: putative signaling protein [Pseudomonadota bacterium]
MFNLTLQQKGWLQAFIAILVFLGINQVMGRFASSVLEVHPIIYSCVAFNSCALVLILNGGRGSLAKETMRSIDTWLYGIVLMFSYIIGMLLFSYISATQGTLLQKVSVLLGLIASWIFFARKPDIFQVIGTAIITVGVIIVSIGVESENKGIIYLLALLYGIFQLVRIFTAELHRPHAKAAKSKNDPKAKSRVIGFVMFIVSTMFLLLTFMIALAQELQATPIKNLPTLSDFSHPGTIFAGFITGILIVAPSRLLEFSSTNIIKAENFTTVTALSFIATVFWENISAPFTGIDVTDISNLDLFAGGLITAGGLLIALTRKLAKKDITAEYLQIETQNFEHIDDTRNIIANSLEHFKHDIKKVSTALDIPTDIIKSIINDKNKNLSFKEYTLKKVSRNYRINIAQKDSLTGLLNRSGFLTKLRAAANEEDTLSLMYLDLNKFKPVNDTYGHKAGDFVLELIGKRLKELFPNKSLVTRLGGDEFCILLIGYDKKQAASKLDIVNNKIEEPISYQDNIISVGTSIGLASFPEDTNSLEDLLSLADKSMYIKKDER